MNTKTPYHAALLAEIARYCETHGVAKSDFGARAVGDRNLVSDLEHGRELRSRTLRRIRDFLEIGGVRS